MIFLSSLIDFSLNSPSATFPMASQWSLFCPATGRRHEGWACGSCLATNPALRDQEVIGLDPPRPQVATSIFPQVAMSIFPQATTSNFQQATTRFSKKSESKMLDDKNLMNMSSYKQQSWQLGKRQRRALGK
jgi:hypothetical protein